MSRLILLPLLAILLVECAPVRAGTPTATPAVATITSAAQPTASAVTSNAISPPLASAVEPPTAPAISPSANPSTPPPASAPASGRHSYTDQNAGISFDYPADWALLPRAPDASPGTTLHGPGLGEGPEPIIFAVTIDVQPVTETSVAEIVNQQMGQVPADLTGGITRKTLTVGGAPAEEVIGLPSLGGAVETFILHKGQLYLVILQPYDESNSSLSPYLPQARSEYDALMASWKFLN